MLTQKSYKSYDRLSRYMTVPYYYNTLTDKYVYGTSTWLDDTTQYSVYKVKQNDTYDSIALDFYNNPTYFWIICSFNRVLNPFEKPAVGKLLKIPSLSNITFN